MRHLVSWTISATLAGVGLLLLAVGPVAADCDGPIPPFRDFADTGRRIVIGTVTRIEPNTGDAFGRSTRFTLRVTDILRGPAVSTIQVRDMAFLPCADHFIAAAEGEQIALAIDARGFQPPRTFATMAWIRAVSEVAPEYRITKAEVIALIGRAPDTATGQPGDGRSGGQTAWAPLVLAALAGGLAWLERSARGDNRPKPVR